MVINNAGIMKVENLIKSQDSHAMPLAEFIAEVMEILMTQLEATEICVKRVYPLRFAEQQGHAKYAAQFQGFNNSAAAAFSV
jgi:uncharacterized oxidoreductase